MRTDADAGSRGTRFVGSDVAPYAEGDLALIGPNLPLAERALRLTGILLDLSQQADRRVLSATALAPEGLPRDQRRMEAVLAYLHKNLNAPIRLAPLCALAHVTESQLQRIFRRSTGLSVNAYVTRLRIGRAATLLARTDQQMSVIAEQCGFHDAAHLARKFRQTVGTTPSAYRRDFRSRGDPCPEGGFPMRK